MRLFTRRTSRRWRGRLFDSWVTVIRLERDKVNLDLILANGVRERLSSMAKRTGAKVVINGSLFRLNDSKVLSHSYRQGVIQGEPTLSRWSIAKTLEGRLVIAPLEAVDREKHEWILEGMGRLLLGGVVDVYTRHISSGIVTRRHPASAIGLNSEHIFFIAAAGRQANSKGVTMAQMAEIALRAGATDAIALDGGGSSRLMDGGRAINKPTENRPVPNAIGAYY